MPKGPKGELTKNQNVLLESVGTLKRALGIADDRFDLDHCGADGKCHVYTDRKDNAELLAELLNQALLKAQQPQSTFAHLRKPRPSSQSVLVQKNEPSGFEVSFPISNDLIREMASKIDELHLLYIQPDSSGHSR